jgi:hypothetical protein
VGQNYGKFEDYNNLERNFFQIVKWGWEGGNTPVFDVEIQYPSGVSKFKSSVSVISIGSVGYEMRYNLYSYSDKASISLSIPFDASLGLAISTPNDGVNTGFFALSSGVMLDFNTGYHSTYNNIDDKGLTIGMGYRIYKAPLFGISERDYKFKRITSGLSTRIMYKTDRRIGKNNIYFYEMGIPSTIEDEGAKIQSNLYFRFGIGSILN